MRDGSGAGCARVSIADHCRHYRARLVGLHAYAGACRGRPAASRSRFDGVRPTVQFPCARGCRSSSGGGAIAALRSSFAGPSRAYASAPVVYAAGPMPVPVAYDTAYHLDAGDKLRVVVYGQEGLTNSLRHRCRRLHHDAADRFGAGARQNARTPRRRHHRQAAQRLYPRAVGGGGGRGLSAVLHPRRGRGPRPISLRAEHVGRKRGGDCRRLLAARPPRPRHAHPYRCPGIDADRGAARHRASAPAIPCWSASAGSEFFASSFRGDAKHRTRELLEIFGPAQSIASSRNDAVGVTSSDASQRRPCCAARRYRRWPCRSWPARRSESRAAPPDRHGSRPRAVSS